VTTAMKKAQAIIATMALGDHNHKAIATTMMLGNHNHEGSTNNSSSDGAKQL
jgi:hypothetical protein